VVAKRGFRDVLSRRASQKLFDDELVIGEDDLVIGAVGSLRNNVRFTREGELHVRGQNSGQEHGKNLREYSNGAQQCCALWTHLSVSPLTHESLPQKEESGASRDLRANSQGPFRAVATSHTTDTVMRCVFQPSSHLR
jgi:hypothetical protein